MIQTIQSSLFQQEYINPLLKENARIPDGSFCTIPEATIHVNTGSATPIFNRQYRVPVASIPAVNQKVESLAGSVIFSILDLKDSYHQFPVAHPDQHKLAFTWNQIQYQFLGCPFGLKPLSSIFQRVISALLNGIPYAKNYVDDIIVFSCHEADHGAHVASVIKLLTQASLRLRPEKCQFGVKSVTVLGHLVSKDGVQVDPAKLKEISAWPSPSTPIQLQHYLGALKSLRKSIPLFSRLAAPLNALGNSKNLKQEWTEEAESALNAFKAILSSAPMLCFPDSNKPFLVATDASNVGIGACIYQLQNEKTNYVQFAALSLSQSQKKTTQQQKRNFSRSSLRSSSSIAIFGDTPSPYSLIIGRWRSCLRKRTSIR